MKLVVVIEAELEKSALEWIIQKGERGKLGFESII